MPVLFIEDEAQRRGHYLRQNQAALELQKDFSFVG